MARTSGNTLPTNHDQAPQAADPFEAMSARDFREYAHEQYDRLGDASAALSGFEDDWRDGPDGVRFEGGNAYDELISDINAQNFEPDSFSDDVKFSMIYMDSVIARNEAHSLLDGNKRHKTQNALSKQERDAVKHNAKIDTRLADASKPLSKRDKNRLEGNRIENLGIIRDAQIAIEEDQRAPSTAPERFMAEVLARRHNTQNPMDDDEFDQLRIEMHKMMRRNLRTARAYTRMTPAGNTDAKSVKHEADNMMQRDSGAVAYAAGIAYGGNIPDQFEDDEAPSNPANPTPPPAPAPANNPPQPLPQTEIERLRGIAERDRREAAALTEYTAARNELARISAKRSGILAKIIPSVRNDKKSELAHERFSAAIFEKMKYDEEYGPVLTNPDLTMEERGAMINAYYMRANKDMRDVSAELQGNLLANKGANFVLRHKGALRLGTYLIAGFTGGPHGLIIGRALEAGIIKAAERQAEGTTKQLDIEKKGEVGSLGSTISGQESLDAIHRAIRSNSEFSSDNMLALAFAAADNLREQYETKFVKEYQRINRNRALGAVASGAAKGGINWAIGEMGYGFIEHQIHGVGGLGDRWVMHDNGGMRPEGWNPIDEPMWMHW